jgi:hypothetical protein
MQDPDIIQNSPPEVTTSILEGLVGDGKKFKTVEDLARGKLASDDFIKKLEEETATLRTQLAIVNETNDRTKLLEQIMTNLNTNTPNPQDTTTVQTTQTTDNQPNSLSLDDIVKLMDAREQARKQTQNWNSAVSEVSKVYGDKAEEFIANKALELGLSVEVLKSLGSTSPKALLNAIGYTNNPNQHSNMTSSSSNTTAVFANNANGNGTRNKAYYDAVQKEMGTTKFVLDKSLQIQLHKDMMALGDAWD